MLKSTFKPMHEDKRMKNEVGCGTGLSKSLIKHSSYQITDFQAHPWMPPSKFAPERQVFLLQVS